MSLVLIVLAAHALVGLAQGPSPRTPPDARPDFQGTYTFDTLTPLERPTEFADKPFLTEIEASDYVKRRVARRAPSQDYSEFWFERPDTLLRVNGRYLTSRIIDPPDGKIPALTSAARQRLASANDDVRLRALDGPEALGLSARCISPAPMLTPGGEANLLQIVQTPEHLLVYTELLGVRRIIPIGQFQPPSSNRSQLGSSRGRWEGAALVVETTNYTGRFGFAFAGIDENLRQIERFSRTDANTLLYQVTIDDSTAYVKPWTFVLTMRRTDARMFEFACHEGNYALENVLRAARFEERGRAADKE